MALSIDSLLKELFQQDHPSDETAQLFSQALAEAELTAGNGDGVLDEKERAAVRNQLEDLEKGVPAFKTIHWREHLFFAAEFQNIKTATVSSRQNQSSSTLLLSSGEINQCEGVSSPALERKTKNAQTTSFTFQLIAHVLIDWLEEGKDHVESRLGRLEHFVFPTYSTTAYYKKVEPAVKAFLEVWNTLAQTGEYETSSQILQKILNGDVALAKEGCRIFMEMRKGNEFTHQLGYTHHLAVEAFIRTETLDDPEEKKKKILESTQTYLLTNGRSYGSAYAIGEIYKDDPKFGAQSSSIMTQAKSQPYNDVVRSVFNTRDPLFMLVGLRVVRGGFGLARLARWGMANRTLTGALGATALHLGVAGCISGQRPPPARVLPGQKSPDHVLKPARRTAMKGGYEPAYIKEVRQLDPPDTPKPWSPGQLIETARIQLNNWLTDKSLGTGYGEFVIHASLLKESEDTAEILLPHYLTKLGEDRAHYRDILTKNKNLRPERQLELLLEAVLEGAIPKDPHNPGLVESMQVTDAIVASRVQLPAGFSLGIRRFSKFTQAVLYNAKTGEVSALTGENHEDSKDVPIYAPPLFFDAFLRAQKTISPIDSKDLLVLGKLPYGSLQESLNETSSSFNLMKGSGSYEKNRTSILSKSAEVPRRGITPAEIKLFERARQILISWQKTGHVDLDEYADFMIQAELAQDYSEVDTLYPKYSKKWQKIRDEIKKALSSSTDFKAQLLAVRKVLTKLGSLTKYRGRQSRFTKMLDGKGGQCLVEALTFLAGYTASGIKPPAPYVFGWQAYRNHTSVVVYNQQTGKVWELFYNSISDKVRAPIYKLPYLFHNYLATAGKPSPVKLEELLIAKRNVPEEIEDPYLLQLADLPLFTSIGAEGSFGGSAPDEITIDLSDQTRFQPPSGAGNGSDCVEVEPHLTMKGSLEMEEHLRNHLFRVSGDSVFFLRKKDVEEYSKIKTDEEAKQFIIDLANQEIQERISSPEIIDAIRLAADPQLVGQYSAKKIEAIDEVMKWILTTIEQGAFFIDKIDKMDMRGVVTNSGCVVRESASNSEEKIHQNFKDQCKKLYPLFSIFEKNIKSFRQKVQSNPGAFLLMLDDLGHDQRISFLEFSKTLSQRLTPSYGDYIIEPVLYLAADPKQVRVLEEGGRIELVISDPNPNVQLEQNRAAKKDKKKEKIVIKEKDESPRYLVKAQTMIDLILKKGAIKLARRWSPSLEKKLRELNENGVYDELIRHQRGLLSWTTEEIDPDTPTVLDPYGEWIIEEMERKGYPSRRTEFYEKQPQVTLGIAEILKDIIKRKKNTK